MDNKHFMPSNKPAKHSGDDDNGGLIIKFGVRGNHMGGYTLIGGQALATLGGAEYFALLIDVERKLMVLQPCGKDDAGAVKITSLKREGGGYVLQSPPFTNRVFREMAWISGKVYTASGEYRDEPGVVMFDLGKAVAEE